MNLIKNLTELKLTQNMGDAVESLGGVGGASYGSSGPCRGVGEGFRPFGEVWSAGGLSTGDEQAAVVDRYQAYTLDNLKIFAEFLQAEAEELAMGSGTGVGQGKGPSLKAVATNPTSGTSFTSMTSPSVGEQRENVAGDKDTCRFWMTEKGCRRGIALA